MPCDAPVITATFCSVPIVVSCLSGMCGEPFALRCTNGPELCSFATRANAHRSMDTLSLCGRMRNNGRLVGRCARHRGRRGMMDRIDAMKVFVAALEEGSLAGAGRKLGRSPAAVSRAIAFLEAHVGAG